MMKCDYCGVTEDVHTLSDSELGPDIHICLKCWASRSEISVRMLRVETPYRNVLPRKTWIGEMWQFKPIGRSN